jgi:nitrogen regulatory protein P-II 2
MTTPSSHTPMLMHRFKMVTIIAEPVLEIRLTQELREFGASGFTVVEGRGEGSRAMHAAEIPGINVRIETIVAPELAERILAHVAQHYFASYEIIAYLSDVEVLRPEKYQTHPPESR